MGVGYLVQEDQTMKIPKKVKSCRCHWKACDCQEWHYQECLKALQVIQIWAEVRHEVAPGYAGLFDRLQSDEANFANIADKCRDVLGALKGDS